MNECVFKNFARSLLLKASMKPLSVGFPGREKSSVMYWNPTNFYSITGFRSFPVVSGKRAMRRRSGWAGHKSANEVDHRIEQGWSADDQQQD